MILPVAGWSPAASFEASAQSLRSSLSGTGCLAFRLFHSGEYDDTVQPRNKILSEQNSSAHSRDPGKQSSFFGGRLASLRRSEEPSIRAVRGSRPSVQTAAHFLELGVCSQHFSYTRPKPQDTGREMKGFTLASECDPSSRNNSAASLAYALGRLPDPHRIEPSWHNSMRSITKNVGDGGAYPCIPD